MCDFFLVLGVGVISLPSLRIFLSGVSWMGGGVGSLIGELNEVREFV